MLTLKLEPVQVSNQMQDLVVVDDDDNTVVAVKQNKWKSIRLWNFELEI